MIFICIPEEKIIYISIASHLGLVYMEVGDPR